MRALQINGHSVTVEHPYDTVKSWMGPRMTDVHAAVGLL